jgi:hypothetical protein
LPLLKKEGMPEAERDLSTQIPVEPEGFQPDDRKT